MKKLHLTLLFFWPMLAWAQLSEGFKYLDSREYDAALSIFEQSLSNENEKLPAQWGILRVFAAQDNAKHRYDSAFALKTQLERGLSKNKNKKDKKRWAKKYNLSGDAIKAETKSLPELRWKELDGTKDLAAFEDYGRIFKNRMPSKVKTAYNKQFPQVLRYAASGGVSDYASVKVLLTKHEKFILDSLPGRIAPLKELLFKSYVDEHEGKLSAINDFFALHPQHQATKHPSKSDFLAAYKADQAAVWLKFLTTHPESPYAPYIAMHTERTLAQKPLSSEEMAKLGEEEKWVLEEMQESGSTGVRITPKSIYDGSNTAQWDNYIRRRAGKPAGLAAVKNMLKYYMGKKDWANAEALLKKQAPLFPQESVWFSKITAMVSTSEDEVKPIRLPDGINTKGDEYSPCISYDGNTLAFCGAGRKESIWGEDVYLTERTGADWQAAKLSRDLSGSGHEAPMCFTADGNTLIFFKNGQVFTSNRTASGWGPANKFPVDISAFGWVSDVHFVPGEQRVFFAARLTGSEWNTETTEIYTAAKDENGTWGTPEKLGAPINSAASDRSPFIHPDQTTMYFSSAREGGFGDLDVYKTLRLDDTWKNWSEPVNLGKNINTVNNNWGYVVTAEGSTAYYSAKVEGRTDEDIFAIELPLSARPAKKALAVHILVQDEAKRPIPNAQVTVLDANTGKNLGEHRTAPKAGTLTLYIPEGDKITISTQQPGYFGTPVSVSAKEDGQNIVITMRPTKDVLEGKTLLNADILFDLGKSELKPEATGQIRFLAEFAKREKLSLSLSGHTDPTGSDEENRILSKARAESVKTALVAAGIAADKITAEGYGETQLICKENTKECHQSNRRVEVKWTKQ